MKFVRQLFRVLQTAESKHYLRLLISPHRTIKAVKYHYRRVSEREFVQFLSRQWGIGETGVDAAYRDFESHRALWLEIGEGLQAYPDGYGQQMTRELPSLYLLVRLMRPRTIVETGVASGASSAHILRALEDNGCGTLFSIDLPPKDLPEGRESGWIVPRELRSRWTLHLGDSGEILPSLLEDEGAIDCFLHDSLHTYLHMLWEFRTAWRHLRPGGLFLSHDVGANDAFFDFMREKEVPWSDYRVHHVLGGFRKPEHR